VDARNAGARYESPEAEELCLSRSLVVAADEERRALERELHDGVQQELIALSVNLQRAAGEPAAAPELLAEIARDVQHALHKTARLAHRIYPPLLEAGGVAATLRAAATAAGIEASVEVAAVADHHAPEAVATVFFCWLAALDGAAKARPTIAVHDEEEALVFEIVTGDRGVERLRGRVEALGGRLTIEEDGDGVRARGSLPVARCR